MESEKVKLSAFLVQGLASLSIASLALLCGITSAWPSYTFANFISNETVLSYPMSLIEASIFGSLPNIGALAATPFCDYAVNTLGRKYSAMMFGLPFLLSWAIIISTSYVPLVIAAMGLSGVGSAGQAISSVYISEISQDSIRGALTSSVVALFFVGLLISYVLGGYLSYDMVLYVNLSISVLYIVVLFVLKESPVFLLQKGNEKEAEESIAFYRRVETTSKEVEREIKKIRLQLDPNIDQILRERNNLEESMELISSQQNVGVVEVESSWKFLMKSESSKKALFASLFLMISNTLMGAIVLQVYAEPLFKEATPTMPSNLCSIILALDFLLSVISCAAIVDRFGRKFLMTSTSIASGVFTLLIATQLMVQFAPHWFTAVLIYAFCYINYLGAATVPFIFMAEVFLPEVRGLGNSITFASLWLTNFITLMVFNPLVENYGLGPLFFGFSAVCFITAVYSHYYLPETKGLSADAIQLLFLKKKRKVRDGVELE